MPLSSHVAPVMIVFECSPNSETEIDRDSQHRNEVEKPCQTWGYEVVEPKTEDALEPHVLGPLPKGWFPFDKTTVAGRNLLRVLFVSMAARVFVERETGAGKTPVNQDLKRKILLTLCKHVNLERMKSELWLHRIGATKSEQNFIDLLIGILDMPDKKR